MSPTFDVVELDRRMADLKTVLHWMEINTGLLRSNLHALELQRNTIATLQNMMSQAAGSPQAATVAGDSKPEAANPAAPWMAAWQQMMSASANLANTKHTIAPAKSPSAKRKTAAQKVGSGSAKNLVKTTPKPAVKTKPKSKP